MDRKAVIRALRRTASKQHEWPMSEYDALTRALARVRRQEKAGTRYANTTEFHYAIQAEVSRVVNDSRYWR
jgi:hypothetical protein